MTFFQLTAALQRPPEARVFLLALFGAALVACASPQERASAYVEKAEKLLAGGDLDQARLEAQNAVQIEPKNARARWVLAQIADKKGEIGQMLGHLEITIAEDPKNLPARLKLGTILIYSQDFDGARLIADAASKLAPDDPGVRQLKARLAIQENQIPAAVQELDFVIGKEPKNVEARLLRGLAQAQVDPEKGLADLAESIKSLSLAEAKPLREARVQILANARRTQETETELKALAADFPLDQYSLRLAEFYVGQNRLNEAEAALRNAVKANPENSDLKGQLAAFQSRIQKKPEVAEATLKQFIKEDPDNLVYPIYLGTFYEGNNRLEEALAQYESIASRDAKSGQGLAARNRIAAIRLRQGKTDEARKVLESILADQPDETTALVARGEINYAARAYNEAVSDLRAALRRQPDNALALLLLARTHARTGESTLAEDAYRTLLQIDSNSKDGALELAELLVGNDQLEEAETYFRKAVELDPKNFVPRSGLVDILLNRGAFDEAAKEAATLAALNDPRGVGQLQLGRALQAKGQVQAAQTAYDRALEKNPLEQRALEGRVTTMMASGQMGAVADYLQRYIDRHPDQAMAKVLLGGNLIRSGKPEAARKILNEVIATSPQLGRAYLTLTAAYPESLDKRVEILRQGLKALPRSFALDRSLGNELEIGGRVDDAIKHYEEVLKERPRRIRIANSLASLLLDARTDRASFERALKLVESYATSNDPAGLDTLGWAHYRLGDFDRAITFLERAAAAGNDVPLVRFHLGMAYLAAKNPVGAKQEFERALEISAGREMPGTRESREQLAKLAGAAKSPAAATPAAASAPAG